MVRGGWKTMDISHESQSIDGTHLRSCSARSYKGILKSRRAFSPSRASRRESHKSWYREKVLKYEASGILPSLRKYHPKTD